MKKNEKLDFLMKITDAGNNTLGKYMSFDASYISRIRTGNRNFPKSPTFIKKLSRFFSEEIENDYQKKVASDFICPHKDWPHSKVSAEKLIQSWLELPETEDPASSEAQLFHSPDSDSDPLSSTCVAGEAVADVSSGVAFYYGNAGKRRVVELFLTDLVQMETPPHLLLYSNEEFDWLYEDPVFAKKWATLLFQFIRKGGHIKIIHTISRASGEMIVALQKWIPIYMTGAIEPYYYPKLLDRVFRKTMFIAEGHSAITASTVGNHSEDGINCLIRDPQAVLSFSEEYRTFLSMCKPLMQIYTITDRDRFTSALKQFHKNPESMITVRATPSFYTMPDTVADSIEKRLSCGWVKKWQEASKISFHAMSEQGSCLTELLYLPTLEDILENRVTVPPCDLLSSGEFTYSASEFLSHLNAIIALLRENMSYSVILTDKPDPKTVIQVKEDVGVILLKSDTPSIAFAITEQRMVSAFWEYLHAVQTGTSYREDTILRLQQLRDQLSETIASSDL